MIEFLIILAIAAAIWHFIPAPEPLKTIGWIILAVVLLLKVIVPLF